MFYEKPNELKELVPFQLFEIDSIKEYLEDMALKGWKLKYIKTFYYFEKIEPQKLYYTIGIIKKPDFHDYKTDNSIGIIQDHREAGWDFVYKNDDIVIFVTDREDVKPIEVDERLKYKNIKRSNKNIWSIILLPLLLNLKDYINIFDVELFTTSYFILLFYTILTISFILAIYKTLRFIIFNIKYKLKLKQGKKILYASKLSIKSKKLFYKIKVIFFIFAFLLVTINIIVYCSTNEKKDNIINSSSTFLASSSTYEHVLKDGSKISIKVFESKYNFILDGYLNSKGQLYSTKVKTSNIYIPEWEALYTYKSGSEYIIVYNNYIISFYSSKPLADNDIKKIKALIK